MAGGNQAAERDGGGTLNIIVEAAQLVAIAFQQGHRVGLGKIFELQQHILPARFHRLNEQIHKVIVFTVGNTRVAPAHIQRIINTLGIVSADVQHNRQRVGSINSAAGGVEREFTNRDAHAADALIAQPQNTFAIGNDNDADVVFAEVLQHFIDVVAVRVGNKQAASTAINIRKVFARFPDGRGVDDRQHLFQMRIHQVIEQRFVRVLDITQIDMFGNITFEI